MRAPPRLTLLVLLVASAAQAEPQTLTIQRGTNGTVHDCYIWEQSPTYNGNWEVLYTGLVGSTDKRTFLSFELPALQPRTRVLEAKLVLENTGTSGIETRLHEVTVPWAETDPTWATFSDNWEPEVVASFQPVSGRNEIDLTALVQQWVQGRANNGLMLEQDTLTSSSTYASSEVTDVATRPALVLTIDDPLPLALDVRTGCAAAPGGPLALLALAMARARRRGRNI